MRYTLNERKNHAHDLILKLGELGVRKDSVYGYLSNNLHVAPGKEHFGAMRSFEEVENGIKVLEKLLKKTQRKARYTPETPRPPKDLQKLQKKIDEIQRLTIDREAVRANLRRTGRINRLVAKFPKPFQRMVRKAAEKVYG